MHRINKYDIICLRYYCKLAYWWCSSGCQYGEKEEFL